VVVVIVSYENLMDVARLVVGQRELPNHAVARINQIRPAPHNQQIRWLGPLPSLSRTTLRTE